jgi:hypothetical protein
MESKIRKSLKREKTTRDSLKTYDHIIQVRAYFLERLMLTNLQYGFMRLPLRLPFRQKKSQRSTWWVG